MYMNKGQKLMEKACNFRMKIKHFKNNRWLGSIFVLHNLLWTKIRKNVQTIMANCLPQILLKTFMKFLEQKWVVIWGERVVDFSRWCNCATTRTHKFYSAIISFFSTQCSAHNITKVYANFAHSTKNILSVQYQVSLFLIGKVHLD